MRNKEWDSLQGEIPNGTLKDKDNEDVPVDGEVLYGLAVCNTPLGTNLFVKKYLEQQSNIIVSMFEMISELLDPAKWSHPEIPIR